MFKVNPPLRTDADVAAVRAGLADGTIDAIATDHAPHTQEAKEQPFDEAPPGMLGLETALALALTELDLPIERGARAAVVAAGRASPAWPTRHGGPVAEGRPANLCVIDPTATWTVDPAPLGQPQPQHAVRRPQAHRPGPPHDPPRRAGRHRRRGPAMIRRYDRDRCTVSVREALLVLADGTTFEGEAIGAEPPGGVATGEVVFNTVLTGYQEVITDPSYAGQIITFTYPHIGNYGVTADDDESRRPFCRGVDRARAGPPPQQLAQRRRPRRLPAAPRRARHRRRSTPAGSPATSARRAPCPARSAPADETALKAAAAGEPGTDGVDLVAAGDHRRAVHGRRRRRRAGSSPTTSASRRRSCATSSGLATVEVVPASTPGRRRAGPRSPTACSCPTARATRRRCRTRSTPSAACSARCRCSASASATSCSRRRSAATTVKLPFGHHGGNHPVRHVGHRPGRDHQPEPQLRGRRRTRCPAAEVTHVNLNDGVIEGLRCPDAPAFSVQYHPEAGPGPHESAYLFDEFAELMDRRSR